jgi:hypothetical protein
MRNPKPGEALKPDRQQRAAPNINVMRFRCDEPKAKLRRVFFMRQDEFFRGRMRMLRPPRISGKISADLPRVGKVG